MSALLLSSATLCSTAAAQCFNIDVGCAPASLPPATYGASTGQWGTWNFAPINSLALPLVDLAAFPTLATLTSTNTGGHACSNNAVLLGLTPAGDLLNDFENVPGPLGTTTWTLGPLAAGTYDVYLYCWDSITPATLTVVTLPSGGPAVTCGSWNGIGIPPESGAYVADLGLIVPPAGFLTWTIAPQFPATSGCFSGVQIRQRGAGCPSAESYCPPGISASGCQAILSSEGTPSATLNSGFVMTVVDVEGFKDGLFYFGANGQQALPWGNSSSMQCVVPPVKRFPGDAPKVGSIGSCDGFFSRDVNSLWCPSGCPKPLLNPGAGATVQAQFWYRDPLNTSNQTTTLSNAIEFQLP